MDLIQIDQTLFSDTELALLVRHMIVKNQRRKYDLTAEYGGIDLTWVVELSDDNKSVHCEMRGPGWTLHATMGQDDGMMAFDNELYLMGDKARFETDIIYLKLVIA